MGRTRGRSRTRRRNRIERRKGSLARLHRRLQRQTGGKVAPLITIYLLCYNEERLLPFTVQHYRRCFPGCKIIICDNESTDSSVLIAKGLGCEIHPFLTQGQFDEQKQTDLKKTVWKSATTPWVIVCDMDELLVCDAAHLKAEETRGATILKTKAYHIVGESNDTSLKEADIFGVAKGKRDTAYDKQLCFRRDKITGMDYVLGAHTVTPSGSVKLSETEYPLYHCKYFGLPYLLSRRQQLRNRASEETRRVGAGTQFDYNDTEIRNEYDSMRNASEPIRSLHAFYKEREL